ncbi:unnamed protein product [Parnassius mnemosyne]|uniref:L-dopachrome isomerase n=1 Tax=Parnassius mnemosyne TaxID=213953 RepID=A0AAV1KZ49_9NEOP
MPCLKILTNIPKSQIPRDFVDKIIPLLAKILKKPENKFTCVISGDCYISFAGESKSPGATATLESIGNLGPNENRVIVKELTDFIEKEIGVHRDRFFLTFYDLSSYNVAKSGVTVEAASESQK